jgi:hypothetical protein
MPLSLGRERYLDREVLISTGLACQKLATAFARLPNLKTVGLRDYNGKGRDRDGPNAQWRSYGWTIEDLDACDFDIQWHQSRRREDLILPLLLHALGEAGAQPRNVEVFLRRVKLKDQDFRVVLSSMQAKMLPMLSNLRVLLLSLEDKRSDGHRRADFSSLRDVLRHTPLLEHFRLNFSGNNAIQPASAVLLNWLGGLNDSFTQSEPPIELKSLTKLDLGMVCCEAGSVLRLISKHPSLTSLSLWKVTLCTSNPDIDAEWPMFLLDLAKAFKHPDQVQTVLLGFCSVSGLARVTPFATPLNGRFRSIQFATKRSDDANGNTVYEKPGGEASYRKQFGSNVSDWLQQLTEKVFRPPSPPHPDYDSDDSEDGENSEDDEDSDDTGDSGGIDDESDDGELD